MIPCATCGVMPTGTFQDGSPRYGHVHDRPVLPENTHPAYRAAMGDAPQGGRLQVRLTDDELAFAREVGTRMHHDSHERGEKATLKSYDPAIAFVLGVQGEIAVSRWADRPYRPVFRRQRGAPDVGRLHVRTRRDPSYGLPVRDHEVKKKRAPFLLVFGRLGEHVHTIRGWIYAGEAARPEWRENYGGHQPAYFVPPEALYDPLPLIDTNAGRQIAGLPPLGA